MKRFDPRVRLPGFITSLFGEAVWRFDETRKVVYLTFDDGPVPEITPWVLELLRAENIKATFFCVGENVMKYPEIYRQILNDGHSVGNHTYNHWQGLKKGNQEYFSNIEKAGEYIDSDLFRPPHGWLKPSQYHFLKSKFRIIMWDLISCDYDSGLNPESVFKNITDFVRPGSVITFHDSIKAQRNLTEALPKSIGWIKDQGYRFEAIPYNKRIIAGSKLLTACQNFKMMINILIVGSGGREHAMAWKIKQSPKLNQLFIAPGNAGTSLLGTNIPVKVSDFEGLRNAVLENQIDLVLVGPEVPLCEGLHDYFSSDEQLMNIRFVGPYKLGAQLEGSKDFAKEFMMRHQIPTAKYLAVTSENLSEGLAFLKTMNSPYVLKADGLAAGKGVLIISDLQEAQDSLREMLDGQFGSASSKVVIEEFLSGIECSVFAITDGKDYRILPVAKDYKRIGEGDTGLNTGGMGSISPVPFADEIFMQKVEERIIKPTVEGLKKDQIPYNGFIFFGLISCGGEPMVIEYNVRMGDPETETVMLRIKSDFVDLLIGAADGTLAETSIEIDERTAAAVMLVSGGYPGDYIKGKVISGLDSIGSSMVFHAGTAQKGEAVCTDGGRVLAISSYGENMHEALKLSYENARFIDYEGMYFRKDLGFDL